MQTNCLQCKFGEESWSILSEIEQSIKAKVEAIGIPLKDWDVEIYRGVLTGYNDAFIITSEKRDEILSNCVNEEEREKTAALIRPILRGRDIKRYGYEWANMYLISTFPARHYDIEKYPAVKDYLLSFAYESLIEDGYDWIANNYLAEYCQKKLEQTGQDIVINGKYIVDQQGHKDKSRKKTFNKWFETQDSISYWDDLSKTKIAWIELSDESKFTLCDDLVPVNTVFFLTGTHLQHILGLLNSKLIHWYFTTNLGTSSGVGTNRWLKYTIEQLPLVEYSNETLSQLVASRLSPDTEIDQCERKIDAIVCEMYGLTPAETSFIIESC